MNLCLPWHQLDPGRKRNKNVLQFVLVHTVYTKLSCQMCHLPMNPWLPLDLEDPIKRKKFGNVIVGTEWNINETFNGQSGTYRQTRRTRGTERTSSSTDSL